MTDGPAAPADNPIDDHQREHLRGSSLMVVGRVLSMGMNLVVQVVAVRYLGKTDYGVFAYALALSALGTNAVLLGQDQSLGRHLPRFEGDLGRSRGATAVAFATVFVLGASLTAIVIGLDALGIRATSNEDAAAVLVILIAVAPLVAFDELFQALFAVVARPTAIFWRRHVVTPGLRVLSVVFVAATGGSVRDLAWAYVLAGVLGVALYVVMLVRTERATPLSGRGKPLTFPVREMIGFGIPVYFSVVLTVGRTTLVIILLEALKSVDAVASFRAVLPIAQLNLIGIQSFRLLFFPAASRLFAADDAAGVRTLYWQSAAWLAVGTFPIFVATFSLAGPVTRLLFGTGFADSARILAVLALGFFVSSSMGLNSHTLRASGSIRPLVVIDVISAVVAVALDVVLIVHYGAFGAAVATSIAVLLQNVLTHVGLKSALGGLPFPREHIRTYLSVAVGATVVSAVELLLGPPLPVSAAVGVVVTAAVVSSNRHALSIGEVIPELRRIPVLGRIVA